MINYQPVVFNLTSRFLIHNFMWSISSITSFYNYVCVLLKLLSLQFNFIKILIPRSLKEFFSNFHIWHVSTYPTLYWFMFSLKKFDMSTHVVKLNFTEK